MHDAVSGRLRKRSKFLSDLASGVSSEEKKLADRSQKKYEAEKESFAKLVEKGKKQVDRILGK